MTSHLQPQRMNEIQTSQTPTLVNHKTPQLTNNMQNPNHHSTTPVQATPTRETPNTLYLRPTTHYAKTLQYNTFRDSMAYWPRRRGSSWWTEIGKEIGQERDVLIIRRDFQYMVQMFPIAPVNMRTQNLTPSLSTREGATMRTNPITETPKYPTHKQSIKWRYWHGTIERRVETISSLKQEALFIDFILMFS